MLREIDMNVDTRAGTQSIRIEYDLPHTRAKVWRALTDSALLAAWLMANDMKPVVGHRFTFTAKPMPGWDGVVHCEVLEVEAEARLSYSWRGGAGPLALDTVVTWTLASTPTGGTRLSLDHAGFLPSQTMAFDGIRNGWAGNIEARLRQVLAGMA
jgi:uncharacterized protein YndB with AHSA1/START domain